MRDNMEIPQEHKEKLFPHIRKAFDRLSAIYNSILGGVLPNEVSHIDLAKKTYPAMYGSIKRIESKLDSYDHTEAEYQKLCEQYVISYTKLFEKIKTYWLKNNQAR